MAAQSRFASTEWLIEMTDFSLQWSQFGAAVAAIGSLGIAAFGIVESLGKAITVTIFIGSWDRQFDWGLPYVGLGDVKRMIRPLRPALKCAYGEGYAAIIAQQYRSNRSQGSAPDTIRQGVRLGLPFLGVTAASALIAAVWHMEKVHAEALARALQASENASSAGDSDTAGSIDPIQALAGRFSTALDARINAAFQLADERYETVAKTAAGVVAVLLALMFNWGLAPNASWTHLQGAYPWPIALGIGLVAVPLAPVAKDLSTSLQNALTAFKSISGKSS